MTRKEMTGKRDLRFSQWIRVMLPDSDTGFRVSDLDFILANEKTKVLMLLEVKTRNASLRAWQRRLLNLLDLCIRCGIKIAAPGWAYCGFHTVVFAGTWFDDGDVFLDDAKIDEEGLRYLLSMYTV